MKTIIVPVSGGKDSQVVLSLALAAGHKPVCVHQNTGYDHPDTYQQIKDMETFYNVEIHHTISKHGGMLPWLEKAAYFPNSAARGCTQRLKQEPFAEWLIKNGYNESNAEIWFGMRADESAARGNKYGGITGDDLFTLGDIATFYSQGKRKHLGLIHAKLPIVDWTTEQIFDHLRKTGAPINPLYPRHSRVGCYPCFLARKAEWIEAGKDKTGIEHITKLIKLEEKWNAREHKLKFIKVHRNWDVRQFLQRDIFQDANDDGAECGWCSI
jgi:3'-phosphoadenosine 5'-phosphosulfate sulfotransferase (PAPS reductase)/FAD synthetase